MSGYELPDGLVTVTVWEVRELAGKRGLSQTLQEKFAGFVEPGKLYSARDIAELTGTSLSNFNRIIRETPGFVKIMSDTGMDTGSFFYLQEFKDFAGNRNYYPGLSGIYNYGYPVPRTVVEKYIPKVEAELVFNLPVPNNMVIQRIHRKHEKEMEALLETTELDEFIQVLAYALAMKWDKG